MSRDFEAIYPYLGGTFVAALWFLLGGALPKDDSALLSSSLTLGAILTGFLATAKAIFISLRNSTVMRELRDKGYSAHLISYMAEAIWLALGFSIMSIIGFFVSSESTTYGTVWAGTGTMTALAFIRVTNIILAVIRMDGDEETTGGDDTET